MPIPIGVHPTEVHIDPGRAGPYPGGYIYGPSRCGSGLRLRIALVLPKGAHLADAADQ